MNRTQEEDENRNNYGYLTQIIAHSYPYEVYFIANQKITH
jgi:hypothetical protein